MKLLIVSDTHGRDANLEAAVLREQPFDMLFHCGDVEGREFYIEALAECPLQLLPETMISSPTFQKRMKLLYSNTGSL